jgi:hypothetical protein
MMGSWNWLGRYALVLLAAIGLGAGLAELTVFKQTMLGTPKLPAASLARFLGYGGALLILWMLAARSGRQIRKAAGSAAHLGFLVLPLATLIVLSVGYDVVLALLRPFLTAQLKDAYNWLFVFGITASALWLVVALYQHAEGFIALAKAVPLRANGKKCGSCGAGLPAKAKFCSACGTAAE